MKQSGETLGFPVSKIEPILGFVADSIQFVHRIAPTKWGVTPCFPGVRLNAGFCEVLTAWPDEIRVLVHREFLPARKPRGLRVEGLEDGFYRSAPGSALAIMRPNSAIQIRKDLEAIREAHQRILAVAVRRGFNPGSKMGHRDWVIGEISNALGRALPLPNHEGSAGGEARLLPEEVGAETELWEGSVRQIRVNAYERDPRARQLCIEHYGTACFICGIDFGDAYGDQVAGLIHVHHLIPLSDVGRRYRVDPIADLRPVCPNCHAVIHAVVPARNIETVRSMIESGKE